MGEFSYKGSLKSNKRSLFSDIDRYRSHRSNIYEC